MTDQLILLLLAIVVVIGFPFVVYLSVKLGTYAYFCGRDLFEREKQNGEK